MSDTTLTSITKKLLERGYQPCPPPTHNHGLIREVRGWQFGCSATGSNAAVYALHIPSNQCWSKQVMGWDGFRETTTATIQLLDGVAA